jgi:hypothetical protein
MVTELLGEKTNLTQKKPPGCRAVELSRLRRGAVEPVVEVLPVEPVELNVEPVEASRG